MLFWEPFLTDTYLAEGDSFHDFLVYVCSALLLKWSDEVRDIPHVRIFQVGSGRVPAAKLFF